VGGAEGLYGREMRRNRPTRQKFLVHLDITVGEDASGARSYDILPGVGIALERICLGNGFPPSLAHMPQRSTERCSRYKKWREIRGRHMPPTIVDGLHPATRDRAISLVAKLPAKRDYPSIPEHPELTQRRRAACMVLRSFVSLRC
jgi:hypothetical protein